MQTLLAGVCISNFPLWRWSPFPFPYQEEENNLSLALRWACTNKPYLHNPYLPVVYSQSSLPVSAHFTNLCPFVQMVHNTNSPFGFSFPFLCACKIKILTSNKIFIPFLLLICLCQFHLQTSITEPKRVKFFPPLHCILLLLIFLRLFIFIARCPNSGTIDVLSWILCCVGCPMHSRRFGRISGLYPTDANSRVVTTHQNYLHTSPNVLWGAKSATAENHWSLRAGNSLTLHIRKSLPSSWGQDCSLELARVGKFTSQESGNTTSQGSIYCFVGCLDLRKWWKC